MRLRKPWQYGTTTPGILGVAASQAWSHYFSGTARNVHNVIGSGSSMAVTVAAGFLLIPAYGLAGAAVSATLAYGTNALYQTVAFMWITRTRFRELWPNKGDVERIKGLIGKLRA